MSTLIMSTGLFCSEPIFFDQQTSYINISDANLYPSACANNISDENQLFKFVDYPDQNFVENNVTFPRKNCTNPSASPALASSEFMNSPYCQAETASTSSQSCATPELHPVVTSNADATIAADVYSLLDQNWTSDSLTSNPDKLVQHPEQISFVDKKLHRYPDESIHQLSQSFTATSVPSHQAMDNQAENILSDLLNSENLSICSKDTASRLHFPADTLNVTDNISQQPFDLDNYFSSIASETTSSSIYATKSLDELRNSAQQSQLQQSKIHQNLPTQQQSGAMQSSSYSFPFDESSLGETSFTSRSVPSVEKLDIDLNFFSSLDSTVTKQNRHHSFTEGFCRSTVSPPIRHKNEQITNQNISMAHSSQQWSKNYGKFEKRNTSKSVGHMSAAVSKNLFKKNIPYHSKMGFVKQDLLNKNILNTDSNRLDVNLDSLTPSLPVETLQDKFISTENLQSSSSSIFSTSCTFNTQGIQKYYSAQNSPTTVDPASNLSLMDIQLFSEHQQHQHQQQQPLQHQQQQQQQQYQQLNFANNLSSDFQFPEVSKTAGISRENNHNFGSQYSSSPFGSGQSPGPSTSKYVNTQISKKTPDALVYNQQIVTSTLQDNYQSSKPKATLFSKPQQRKHHFSPYSRHGKSGQFSRRSSRIINEGLCVVCGDNAACQHYGVRTCEGCKGFFKRTVQKKATYVCLANKNCPVDKRRRNRCQFCRFEKCLAVGMVKEVVRTDELKGRRGRLPSKAKGPKDPVAIQSPPVSFITSLVRAHIDTNPTSSCTDTSQFHAPGTQPTSSFRSVQEQAKNFYELLASCLLVLRQWAEKIPGFCTLTQEDQKILIESSFLEVFVLRLSYRFEIQEGKFVFCNGSTLHRDQMYHSFGDWSNDLINFGSRLSDLNVDISSFSCILALLLFQDRPNLRERYKVEKLRGLTIESLKEHINKSPITSDRPNFFMSILAFMPEIRNLASSGARKLYQFKTEFPSILFPQSMQKTLDVFINPK